MMTMMMMIEKCEKLMPQIFSLFFSQIIHRECASKKKKNQDPTNEFNLRRNHITTSTGIFSLSLSLIISTSVMTVVAPIKHSYEIFILSSNSLEN